MGKRFAVLCLSSVVAAIIVVTVACGGGGDSSSSVPQLRVIQASPNEPDVNILVDGTSMEDVNYGAASSYLQLKSGSRHIQIQANGSTSFLVDKTVSFSGGTSQTWLISGLAPNIATPTFTDTTTVAT